MRHTIEIYSDKYENLLSGEAQEEHSLHALVSFEAARKYNFVVEDNDLIKKKVRDPYTPRLGAFKDVSNLLKVVDMLLDRVACQDEVGMVRVQIFEWDVTRSKATTDDFERLEGSVSYLYRLKEESDGSGIFKRNSVVMPKELSDDFSSPDWSVSGEGGVLLEDEGYKSTASNKTTATFSPQLFTAKPVKQETGSAKEIDPSASTKTSLV